MVWWELVFMLIVLKIPIVYLCAVVWWAIKAEPRPEEPAVVVAGDDEPDDSGPRSWGPVRRRRRPGPHGSPQRRPGLRHAPRTVAAHAKVER